MDLASVVHSSIRNMVVFHRLGIPIMAHLALYVCYLSSLEVYSANSRVSTTDGKENNHAYRIEFSNKVIAITNSRSHSHCQFSSNIAVGGFEDVNPDHIPFLPRRCRKRSESESSMAWLHEDVVE